MDFRKMRIALIGAGVSNTPLVDYFMKKGASVSVRDSKSEAELGDERCSAIKESGARLICGEGYLSGLSEELIIRSPGIRPDIPEFVDAAKRGARITTELGLFMELCPARKIAVTGSDGKSTTTTITSLFLEAGLKPAGRAYLGGNIGEPLLHRLDGMSESDGVAAEMSSFQLMDADFEAESSVITNISPNHLNWHTDMDEYIAAKERAVRRCGRAVLNWGCGITRKIGLAIERPVVWFSGKGVDGAPEKDTVIKPENGVITVFCPGEEPLPLLPLDGILLPGMHNAENYMAAIGATLGIVSADDIRRIAAEFGGVRHRLELIRTIDGMAFYNSSIDSSPTRTAAALSALPGRNIYLICGGSDKHISFDPLADAIISCGCVRALILTGATAEKIRGAVTGHAGFEDSGIELVTEPAFDGAVAAAAEIARRRGLPDSVVLLSPACASFDAFANFEERGRRFCELVREISE